VTPEDCQTIVRDQGMCGALSPGGERVCILDPDHGAHEWDAPAQNHWFVVLAVDKEAVRGFIEGVVPASYKPSSTAVWCMCRADTRERAIEMAMETYADDLAPGESLALASISQLWNSEPL
jgi:hypothetical protein